MTRPSSPAFVVLAHKHPQQVARLADRLAPLPVFVHVDASRPRAAQDAFAAALSGGSNVHLVRPRRSGWASWGLVAAALDGLRDALADPATSHVMLISGQDYPLRPAEALRRFFLESPDTSFVARWPLPTPLWGDSGGMDRLRPWQVPVRGRRVRLPFWPRLPAGLDLYGGSMYWALSAAAGRDVLALTARRPELARFFRHTWIPDEMFVQTLLMNSPSAATVTDEGLTYLRWPQGSRHPAVLRGEELPGLRIAATGPSEVGGSARSKLFARKFDATIDPSILDAIDGELLGRCA